MILYIENRVFYSAGNIIDYDSLPLSIDLSSISEVPLVRSFTAIATASQSPTNNFLRSGECDSIDISLNQNLIEFLDRSIRLDTEIIDKLSESIDSDILESLNQDLEKWYLKDSVIRVLEHGCVNFINIFDFNHCSDVSIQNFELIGVEISKKISTLFPVIESILNSLEIKGILHFNNFYRFGILELKTQGEETFKSFHSIEYSYLFNQILVFDEEQSHREMSIPDQNKCETINFSSEEMMAHLQWSKCYWVFKDTPHKNKLMKFLDLDTHYLSEDSIYATVISCYTDILRRLSRPSFRVTSGQLRIIANLNRAMMQTSWLKQKDLTELQQKYVQTQRELGKILQDAEMYESAEQALHRAVEGKEAQEEMVSGRIIQWILFIFTLLTLYSVTKDIIAFITIPTSHHLDFFNSMVFSVITLVIAIFTLLFRKLSKP